MTRRRNYGKPVPKIDKPWFGKPEPVGQSSLAERFAVCPPVIFAENETDYLRIKQIADECRVNVIIRVGGQ